MTNQATHTPVQFLSQDTHNQLADAIFDETDPELLALLWDTLRETLSARATGGAV